MALRDEGNKPVSTALEFGPDTSAARIRGSGHFGHQPKSYCASAQVRWLPGWENPCLNRVIMVRCRHEALRGGPVRCELSRGGMRSLVLRHYSS